jgi:hypothetical protein
MSLVSHVSKKRQIKIFLGIQRILKPIIRTHIWSVSHS